MQEKNCLVSLQGRSTKHSQFQNIFKNLISTNYNGCMFHKITIINEIIIGRDIQLQWKRRTLTFHSTMMESHETQK